MSWLDEGKTDAEPSNSSSEPLMVKSDADGCDSNTVASLKPVSSAPLSVTWNEPTIFLPPAEPDTAIANGLV